MLLVFRQHRLASSATGGASVMLHTSSSSGAAFAGSRGAAHKKAGTHRFCAAKLLALKNIGFLMTGKKKARRNAPAFQALFSQHGAKRLTFKRCLLAFLWAQFAFLLQAFSFSNKKKIPKRGKYKSFNYSWTRKQEAYFYRAAVAAAVRRGRRTLQMHANKTVIISRADDFRPTRLC